MRPFTIAVVASKGGVGKSVLAASLAAHAVKAGHKVALVDMDAQGSLTMWHRMRGSPDTPAMIEPGRPSKADVTIIDTPPSHLDVIARAVKGCDVALIPVRSGAFDIAAITATVHECQRARKMFLLVLNAVDARRRDLTAEAMKALRQLGPTFGTVIENRAVYVATLHHGLTGPEGAEHSTKPKAAVRLDAEGAAEEIGELWKAIHTVLKHARGQQ
jgi:chromosome partitioning protein